MDSLSLDAIIIIDDVIDFFLENDGAFTAYDISKEVKNRKVNLKHYEMRNYIHSKMEDHAVRSRTLVCLDNGRTTYVYHTGYEDPYEYAKGIQVNNTDKTSDDCKTYGNNDGSCKMAIVPDGRGRICVPSCALKSIGLNHGDKVYVVCCELVGEIFLFKDENLAEQKKKENSVSEDVYFKIGGSIKYLVPPVHVYSVDKSGNIRIVKSTIEKGSTVDSTLFLYNEKEFLVLKSK